MSGRTMPFGKYRGQPVAAVPDEYLEWLLTIELREPLRTAVYREAEERGFLDDGGASSAPPESLPTVDLELVSEIVGAARRSLALRYHPDTGLGDVRRMQAINAACDLIIEWARSAAATREAA